MQFVEREYELSRLSTIHDKMSAAFVIIYGRRRIGKTETVRYFCEDKSISYLEFAGKLDQSKSQQIQAFARKLSRYAPELKMGNISSWQDIFYLLEDYIEEQPKDETISNEADHLDSTKPTPPNRLPEPDNESGRTQRGIDDHRSFFEVRQGNTHERIQGAIDGRSDDTTMVHPVWSSEYHTE